MNPNKQGSSGDAFEQVIGCNKVDVTLRTPGYVTRVTANDQPHSVDGV
jgi:hypothetical protein